jgi:geranylgeranyl pyrophosphate synthase
MHDSLKDYLRTRKTLVDAALDARLPHKDTDPRQVHTAMRYATLSNGKRLRPVLSLAVSDLAGSPPECVMGSSCAIELIHTASLILDDLPCMDNAPSRRGLPATHVQFGEATALLAVTGLVALAFDLVTADIEASGDKIPAAPAVRLLARAVGTQGLVRGQHMDLVQTGRECSVELLEEGHRCKAGALFLACVQIPAYILGMTPEEGSALESYARNIGLAFQIADDLLDARGGSEDLGKSTFVTLFGRDAAEQKARALVQGAIDALRPFENRAERLQALATYVTARNQ